MREEREIKELFKNTKKSLKKDFTKLKTRKEKLKQVRLTIDFLVTLSSKVIESSIRRSIEQAVKEVEKDTGISYRGEIDYLYSQIAERRFKGKSFKERLRSASARFTKVAKQKTQEEDFDVAMFTMILSNQYPVGGTLFRHMRRLLLGESHRAKYQTKQILATTSSAKIQYLSGHSSHRHLDGLYSPEELPEFNNPFCTCELKLHKNKERK